MDLEQMKAAVTMEGVLSGTAVLGLIAEVERLEALCAEYRGEVDPLKDRITALECEVEESRALCDGYRGEVEGLKQWDSLVCSRCHGIGETTAISGQTPESYSQENIPCPDCVGPIIDERDAALSALTRARAEGMEEAAKIAECTELPNSMHAELMMRNKIATSIRARTTKGDSDEG